MKPWHEELERGEMMYEFCLSWTVGIGSSSQGGNQRSPQWLEVESQLEQIRDRSGTVTLAIVNGVDIGPQQLQVQSDGGNYLLMLGEIDEGDYHVRSFTNVNSEPGQIEILGALWDSKMVLSDFNIIRRAFKEFFHTGDVSQALLS